MEYAIKFDPRAKKQLDKLDKQAQKRILTFLYGKARLNPRLYKETLKGKYSEFWKFKVGDYRIIFELEKELLSIYLIGHRKEVYKLIH